LEGALSRDNRPLPAFARALWKIDRKYVPLAIRLAVKSLPQGSALGLLEEIGPEAAEAVPAIISSLAKRDLRFNPYASPELRALRAIGRPTVPALAESLTSEDVIIRSLAAETLGRIGADARAALPALEKALSDEDDEVRREAAKALRKIRGAAVPADPAAESRP
jgi:HEAT repeat protein